MHGVLISKTTFLKCLQKEEYNTIYAKIKQLERDHKATGNKFTYDNLLREHKNLNLLESEKIKNNLIFFTKRYWHNSPRTLKLLAWRVNQRKMENVVHAIKTPAANLMGRTSEILTEFERYYSSLYHSTSPTQKDQDSFFENTSLFQRLTDHHREFLDGAI